MQDVSIRGHREGRARTSCQLSEPSKATGLWAQIGGWVRMVALGGAMSLRADRLRVGGGAGGTRERGGGHSLSYRPPHSTPLPLALTPLTSALASIKQG